MRSPLIASLVLVAALVSLTGCEPSKSATPKQSPGALKVTVGDGSWSVGSEIVPGQWTSAENLSKKPNCGWYIMPTPKSVAPANPNGTVTIVLKLGEAKTFTTSGCGTWKWKDAR